MRMRAGEVPACAAVMSWRNGPGFAWSAWRATLPPGPSGINASEADKGGSRLAARPKEQVDGPSETGRNGAFPGLRRDRADDRSPRAEPRVLAQQSRRRGPARARPGRRLDRAREAGRPDPARAFRAALGAAVPGAPPGRAALGPGSAGRREPRVG